jgi:hypothetical protein
VPETPTRRERNPTAAAGPRNATASIKATNDPDTRIARSQMLTEIRGDRADKKRD